MPKYYDAMRQVLHTRTPKISFHPRPIDLDRIGAIVWTTYINNCQRKMDSHANGWGEIGCDKQRLQQLEEKLEGLVNRLEKVQRLQ
jgi:hypothetical protein